MILNYIATAGRQLIRNAGRSILTMLGIIIGIGSVIFIMTVGEVAKNFLLSQISQFGTNVVEVYPMSIFDSAPSEAALRFSMEDIETLYTSDLLPEITAVSSTTTLSQLLDYDGEEKNVTIMADFPTFFAVNSLEPLQGRLYSQRDVDTRAKVVVMGEKVAEHIFGRTDVVGERVKVGGTFFQVIGISEDFDFGPFGFGLPDMIFMPITTAQIEFGEPANIGTLDNFLIQFEPDTDYESFSNRLDFVLRQEYDLLDREDEVFTIVNREQGLDIFSNVLLGIQAFISAVAGISLVVGGIGIMNIMLVTVSERTKEIGLRKAIGAKNHSILTQFLTESVVLTTVGGGLGILIGLGLTYAGVLAINAFQPDWDVEFVFVPQALILACGVVISVGLIFGIYPALKASRLSPNEALRYE